MKVVPIKSAYIFKSMQLSKVFVAEYVSLSPGRAILNGLKEKSFFSSFKKQHGLTTGLAPPSPFAK